MSSRQPYSRRATSGIGRAAGRKSATRPSTFACAADVTAASDADHGGVSRDRKGSSDMRPLPVSIASGLALSALAWIDPLFIPLVIAGPPISGALAASRGIPYHWPALAWTVAGIGMLVSDWLINQEDVAFHAALTVLMAAFAALGAAVTAGIRRRRRRPRPVSLT
jgi:hypothetical protein